MSTTILKQNDREAISAILQHYISGARSGSGDEMRPAFHTDATIFGFVGNDLFAGPIERLFLWTDENGPATELRAEVANIDISETVATARLELENWNGNRFTDLFTLLKIGGQWRIMNKVFHHHP